MDVYEITGYQTGVSQAGVNYLQPSDSFQNIINGFIYRQVLQSRQGIGFFAPRLANQSRVLGIFEHTLVDGTTQLLAFDTAFLYKFNTGTGLFDAIPFGGSMAAYLGFNITGKDQYISGVSYPTGSNTSRFVFTSPGITPNAAGSQIFFFDGTNVLDYTNVADNPDYAPPPMGQLTAATYVLYFNERINFIIPIIAGTTFNQGILFSGIRTASGNGDKFNIAGSGLFQLDTYQFITGASILGQVMVLNLDRSVYVLEITSDAFNPYKRRIVPGVLGTNAKFSAVAWDDEIDSIGKTAILATDGRRNLRIDNKIPTFTADEIDQVNFNLTYGGFDRVNNQFLWSYLESESGEDTQNRILVKNYEESTWSIFKQRLTVFGQTVIGLGLNWNQIDETTGNESWAAWNTTEEIWNKIGLGTEVQKTLAGDDLGFIYDINQDFDDYYSDISNIVQGPTTFITISATGIKAGDLITISGVQGMTEINNFDPETGEMIGPFFEVLSATPTLIEINADSTNLTPYTTGGSVSVPIDFSAETIPFNPYRPQGRRCYVGYVEFLIDTNGGSVTVDVYADQQTTPFRQDVLCKPKNLIQSSAEWVSMSIDQEANFITFVLKQRSPAVQLRLTNMRIHCEPGGFTSG